MAFGGIKCKLGLPEYDEYFNSIAYRNTYRDEDNSILTVLRAVMNEKRLSTFTAKSGVTGKMQFQIVSKEFRLTGDDAKLDASYYGGEHGPFKQTMIGLWMNFIPNKNAAAHIKEIKNFDADYKKLGYTRLEDVSLYLDRGGDVLVYQNESKQATLVFAPAPKRIQVMQMAASCLPRIFPWAFKDEPLTEDEIKFLKLLAEQKYLEFNDAMERVFAAYDFYGKKVAGLLKGFCNQNYARSISSQEERVRNKQRNLDDYLTSARDAQKQLEEEQLKLITIRNRACNSADDEKELIDFLKSNKSLIVLRKSGSDLRLGVNCYLNDYNEDVFKQYVENADKLSSYIYSASPYSLPLTKKLFLAIWKEHRFNLRVYCEWEMHDDCSVSAIRDSGMNGREDLMEDRIPQPHIDDYTCYSGYRGILNDLAIARDYIGILSTLVTSSSYINWTDSCVVSTMMDWLFHSKKDVKCLEDKDGNHYTVAEVVEILKKEA